MLAGRKKKDGEGGKKVATKTGMLKRTKPSTSNSEKESTDAAKKTPAKKTAAKRASEDDATKLAPRSASATAKITAPAKKSLTAKGEAKSGEKTTSAKTLERKSVPALGTTKNVKPKPGLERTSTGSVKSKPAAKASPAKSESAGGKKGLLTALKGRRMTSATPPPLPPGKTEKKGTKTAAAEKPAKGKELARGAMKKIQGLTKSKSAVPEEKGKKLKKDASKARSAASVGDRSSIGSRKDSISPASGTKARRLSSTSLGSRTSTPSAGKKVTKKKAPTSVASTASPAPPIDVRDDESVQLERSSIATDAVPDTDPGAEEIGDGLPRSLSPVPQEDEVKGLPPEATEPPMNVESESATPDDATAVAPRSLSPPPRTGTEGEVEPQLLGGNAEGELEPPSTMTTKMEEPPEDIDPVAAEVLQTRSREVETSETVPEDTDSLAAPIQGDAAAEFSSELEAMVHDEDHKAAGSVLFAGLEEEKPAESVVDVSVTLESGVDALSSVQHQSFPGTGSIDSRSLGGGGSSDGHSLSDPNLDAGSDRFSLDPVESGSVGRASLNSVDSRNLSDLSLEMDGALSEGRSSLSLDLPHADVAEPVRTTPAQRTAVSESTELDAPPPRLGRAADDVESASSLSSGLLGDAPSEAQSMLDISAVVDEHEDTAQIDDLDGFTELVNNPTPREKTASDDDDDTLTNPGDVALELSDSSSWSSQDPFASGDSDLGISDEVEIPATISETREEPSQEQTLAQTSQIEAPVLTNQTAAAVQTSHVEAPVLTNQTAAAVQTSHVEAPVLTNETAAAVQTSHIEAPVRTRQTATVPVVAATQPSAPPAPKMMVRSSSRASDKSVERAPVFDPLRSGRLARKLSVERRESLSLDRSVSETPVSDKFDRVNPPTTPDTAHQRLPDRREGLTGQKQCSWEGSAGGAWETLSRTGRVSADSPKPKRSTLSVQTESRTRLSLDAAKQGRMPTAKLQTKPVETRESLHLEERSLLEPSGSIGPSCLDNPPATDDDDEKGKRHNKKGKRGNVLVNCALYVIGGGLALTLVLLRRRGG